jgi:hypothetical protein
MEWYPSAQDRLMWAKQIDMLDLLPTQKFLNIRLSYQGIHLYLNLLCHPQQASNLVCHNLLAPHTPTTSMGADILLSKETISTK